MAKIVGIIQVKGGAGRSTIATNLAAAISEQLKTALIDCDMPQGTSASWYALRQEERPIDSLTLLTAATHNELARMVEQASQSHSLVIIDAPPRIAEITRTILILADLCLIPVGASAAEIWATTDLLNTITEAKKVQASGGCKNYLDPIQAQHQISAGIERDRPQGAEATGIKHKARVPRCLQ